MTYVRPYEKPSRKSKWRFGCLVLLVLGFLFIGAALTVMSY